MRYFMILKHLIGIDAPNPTLHDDYMQPPYQSSISKCYSGNILQASTGINVSQHASQRRFKQKNLMG